MVFPRMIFAIFWWISLYCFVFFWRAHSYIHEVKFPIIEKSILNDVLPHQLFFCYVSYLKPTIIYCSIHMVFQKKKFYSRKVGSGCNTDGVSLCRDVILLLSRAENSLRVLQFWCCYFKVHINRNIFRVKIL